MFDWPIFRIGDTETTLGSLLVVIAIAAGTVLIGRLARSAVRRRFQKLHAQDDEAAGVYGFVAQLIIWFIGLELALHSLGIHLTSILAASGFLAIGAGFAAKNILENFMSGGILRLEKTIRHGDIVIVDGKWIVIQRVGIRITEATTYEGEDILIPNSLIAQSMVQNLTRRGRQCRINMGVGVDYNSDLALVRKTLEETVDKLDWRLKDKQPEVFLVEFAESSVHYQITLWVDDVTDSFRRKSDLHEAIWWALKDKGINIAYPQLDLHLADVAGKPA
jgi:small-conductance mechanosensitive channel